MTVEIAGRETGLDAQVLVGIAAVRQGCQKQTVNAIFRQRPNNCIPRRPDVTGVRGMAFHQSR